MRAPGLLPVFILLLTIVIAVVVIFYVTQPTYWKRLVADIKPTAFGKKIYRTHAVYGSKESRTGTISYSLYGNYEKYSKNLRLSLAAIPELLPGWVPRVYTGGDIPKNLIVEFVKMGAEIYVMDSREILTANSIEQSKEIEKFEKSACKHGSNPHHCKCKLNPPLGHEGATWRFLAAAEQAPFLSLDADDVFDKTYAKQAERLYYTHAKFINFSRLRMGLPMMAGLWGGKSKCIPDIQYLLDKYYETGFGYDEAFLKKEVWPRTKKACRYDSPYFPFVGLFASLILITAFVGIAALVSNSVD